ncbi:MAG: penicillin-binding protein 1A [Snowella sp.]|nr:penicillin-binding protein 1A [Snowella sp.]
MPSSTIPSSTKDKTTTADSEKSFGQGVIKIAGGTILGVGLLASAAIAGGLAGLAISFRNLPDVRTLKTYVPAQTSYIYDVKGRELLALHDEAHRKLVSLEQISPDLKRAVMAIEDSSFYNHQGINPNSIGRALLVNFKSGGVSEGASTLSMQLVKNIFLSQQRTVTRKAAEAVLAIRVEQVFDKNQILEMYLNTIYWGHNNYGIQTAAESYFKKPAAKLNLAESAMLAGMIQAPESYSPFNKFKAAKARQEVVLDRMAALGWITPQESEAAKKAKLNLGEPTAWRGSKLPYVTDAVIKELTERFGKEAVIKGGMRVQTTVDYDLQKKGEAVVHNAYKRLRGRLRGKNLQIALVSVDPRTHYIKTIVGGVDYNKSQLNRAIQSRRQPGSSFKPFVYYTAFASGKYTPDSVVYDGPIRIRDGAIIYSPKNYGGGFSGPMSIRSALAVSQNIPAVVVGSKVGMNRVVEACRRMGIKSPLMAVPSLPLGSVDVTPLDMASAYATLASNGWYSEPTIIMRVTDSQGNVLLDNTPKPQLVLDPWAAANTNSIMTSVVNGGTGRAASLGRPTAGKTGTTDNERNVWFVGHVPQMATAVWLGNDNNASLGKGISGGHYAAPIWRSFMSQAVKDMPVEYFAAASKFPKPKPSK